MNSLQRNVRAYSSWSACQREIDARPPTHHKRRGLVLAAELTLVLGRPELVRVGEVVGQSRVEARDRVHVAHERPRARQVGWVAATVRSGLQRARSHMYWSLKAGHIVEPVSCRHPLAWAITPSGVASASSANAAMAFAELCRAGRDVPVDEARRRRKRRCAGSERARRARERTRWTCARGRENVRPPDEGPGTASAAGLARRSDAWDASVNATRGGKDELKTRTAAVIRHE